MRVAIVGSRVLTITCFAEYMPEAVEEIITGGARGIDTCAEQYARDNGIRLTEIVPDYPRYGRAAPLKRNEQIVSAADIVIAFWDGASRGTKYVIDYCEKKGVPIRVVLIKH